MRIRNGETLVTDGPFAETKEQLGGYYVLDCENIDEALAVRGEDPGSRDRLDRGASRLGDVAPLERVFREEYARVVATLIRDLRDIDLAEDALSDAFEAALVTWPRTGVPDNPGAWLTVTARRKAIDRLRRERRHAELVAQLEEEAPVDETTIPDERLSLVFTCCHPALAPDAQVALTLRLVGGLTTTEIARAFLVTEETLAQRSCGPSRRSARRASRTGCRPITCCRTGSRRRSRSCT